MPISMLKTLNTFIVYVNDVIHELVDFIPHQEAIVAVGVPRQKVRVVHPAVLEVLYLKILSFYEYIIHDY